jgi:hypothetical protein
MSFRLLGCASAALVLFTSGCARQPAPARSHAPAQAGTGPRAAAPLASDAIVVAGGPIELEIRVSGVAQLGYQLDCLAGLERCARARVEALWTEHLGWHQADEDMLAAWSAIAQRYHTSIRLPLDAPGDGAPGVFPTAPAQLALRDKLRQAALLADDVAAYHRHVSLLMAPGDAARMSAVLAHFASRFAPWWQQQVGPARAFARGLAALLHRRDVAGWIADAASFYGARLAGAPRVHVHVVMLPASASTDPAHGSTVAEQIENHSVLEVLPGEAAAERAPVLLHELCHFFYRSMEPAARERVMAALLGSGSAAAVGALHLLDESVAAALGNGVAAERIDPQRFQRRMAQPRGLYDDAWIDPVARALVPALAGLLARGETIHGGAFAGAYLAAFAAALGDLGHVPALRLRTAAVLFDASETSGGIDDLDPILRALREHLGVGAMYASAPIDAAASHAALRAYPALSGLVAVRYAHLDQLADWPVAAQPGLLARLRGLAAQHGAFVYELPRSPQASVYIVAGRDAGAIAGAIARLAALGRTAGGVIATLDVQ